MAMGPSPAVLGKRDFVKPKSWCPNIPIDFDEWCDPDNPKTVTYKDILKAAPIIKDTITDSRLVRSRSCQQLQMELYFKFEIFHTTGSFNERGALYALLMLGDEERMAGVITASLGNFAVALAYHACKLNIQTTVVLPKETLESTRNKCSSFGAKVIVNGKDLDEAKFQAFTIASDKGYKYINGYDHPHVIAGSGTIGLEILEELPETDVILVPVGGGGLIAGVAAISKHLKPTVDIYGIEPEKCSSFIKAMQNGRPYQTAVVSSVAGSLEVPTVGYNAFHTAHSLIDKMVSILVDDDWIMRGMANLLEEERFAVEGAGSATLGAILSTPNMLPELKDKTVVCVITGANIDHATLHRSLERAKAVEGRLIKLTMKLPADDELMKLLKKILSMISNIGCNIVNCEIEHAWLTEDDFENVYFTLVCETSGLEHACTLRRVLNRLFPGICDFLDEPFSPAVTCICYPKRHIII